MQGTTETLSNKSGRRTPNYGSQTSMTMVYPNVSHVRTRSPVVVIPTQKKPDDVFKASGT